MSRPKYVQSQDTTLKSGLASSETTSITLKDLKDIYGNELTMTDFGDTGHLTVNPKVDGKEEIISFTTLTTNSDGTVTLGGITRGLSAVFPYASGGTARDHGAGDVVIASNNPQTLEAILDYIDGIAIAGAPDASTIAKGIFEEATEAEIDADTDEGSTGARLAINPSTLATSKYGTRLPSAEGSSFLSGVTGMIVPYAGISAPTGFLLCNAQSVSNDTYSDLLAVVLGRYGYGTATNFTADNATNTFTATSHGLSDGEIVLVDSSASDLPDGLTTNTIYYVISSTTNTFQLSTSSGGSAVSISDDGTGTHSFYQEFKVPDLKSRFPLGYSASAPTKVFNFASRSSNTITVTGDSLANTKTNEIQTGQKVRYSTTGTVITGLTNNTDYYIIRVAYNQFKLASSVNLANAGASETEITLSGDGSGVQTFTITNTARAVGEEGGSEYSPEVGSHSHYRTYPEGGGSSSSNQTYALSSNPDTVIGFGLHSGGNPNSKYPSAHTEGGSEPNNMPPFTVVNYIIKT